MRIMVLLWALAQMGCATLAGEAREERRPEARAKAVSADQKVCAVESFEACLVKAFALCKVPVFTEFEAPAVREALQSRAFDGRWFIRPSWLKGVQGEVQRQSDGTITVEFAEIDQFRSHPADRAVHLRVVCPDRVLPFHLGLFRGGFAFEGAIPRERERLAKR